ncbi:MAG: hypothetical protein DRO43_01655 [Candidatus Hecatellales archaeon]|nr:MAG: hypothetical protein DRO43_01655 [Candidatus Hecatellales archaeon]
MTGLPPVPLEVLTSFAVGFLTGVYGALFGFGGGFIFVPYFYLALNMPIHMAIGSSLASIIFLTSSAVVSYGFFQRRIDLKLALLLMVAAAPSAFLGAWLTRYVDPYLLRIFFSALLAYAGVNMALELKFEGGRRRLLSFPTLWRRTIIDEQGVNFRYEVNPLLAVLGGAGAGFISGLAGVGGGLVNMPLMCLVLGVPIHVAVATSELATLINVVSGSMGHFLAGNIDFYRVAVVGSGALLGAYVGTKVCVRMKPRILRRALGLVLLLVTVRMIFWG